MKEKTIKDAMGSIENRIRHVYNQGYEQGRNERYIGYGDAYTKGLNDAWEAAKKIALMDTETSENVTGYFGLFRIMDNLTASEAIAKIKEYEDKQKQDADRCRECEKMRKGHWIYDQTLDNWRCSKCNETPKTMGYVGTADFMAEHFKFCNHCGAKMESEE